MDNGKSLYKQLSSDKLYTKSYDEFVKQYGNPEGQKELFNKLSADDLYTKSEQEFVNQYWAPVKKKESTASASTLPPAPSPLGSKNLGEKLVSEFSGKVTKEVKPKPGESQGLLLIDPDKVNKYNPAKPNWLGYIEPYKELDVLNKEITGESASIAQGTKEYRKQQEALNAEVAKLNDFISYNKLTPEQIKQNPELNLKVQNIEQRQKDLSNQFNGLSSRTQYLDQNISRTRKQAAAVAYDKSKQGSVGGAIWNTLIGGIGSISRGLDESLAATYELGAQTLDLFGIKPEALEKKPWLKFEEGGLKKEYLKQLQGRHKPAIESLKSKGTTEEYAKDLQKNSKLAAVTMGVVGSAPAMVLGPAALILQGVGSAREEIDANPETKNLTENEKAMIAYSIGTVGGILEEFGVRAIGKGIAKGPIGQFTSYVLSRIPSNAGIKVVKQAVKEASESDIGKLILSGKKNVDALLKTTPGKVASDLAQGFGTEYETGFEQSAFTNTVYDIVNKAKDKKIFNTPEFATDEFIQQAHEDAVLEGLGFGLMYGASSISQKLLQEPESVSVQQYEALKEFVNDPALIKAKLALVRSDLTSNKINNEQARVEIENIKSVKSIMSQIPDDLSQTAQREAFLLIKEKDALSKQLAGKNTLLVGNKVKRIEEIDNKLKKLSEDAVQEQTTSEVPVQPEAGVGGEVAQGESQPETQVPTEEGQVEEVTTPQAEEVVTETISPEEVSVTETTVPTEMTPEEWTAVQDLADRISKGEEVTTPEDLQLQQNYPKAIEKLLAKKAEFTQKEESKPEEKTKLSDTQKTAIQEAVKRGEDMVKRYPKQDDLILKYKALQQFQKKNQAYIDADQSQKDEMTRQINFALGLAPKKSAPSAKRILGIKPTMVTVDQMASLKDQLMMQEKAAKGGVDFANKAKKIVNDTIKKMEKGALNPKDTNALLSALNGKAETPEQRREIISKVISIFKRSEGNIAIKELDALNNQFKDQAKGAKLGAKAFKEQVANAVDQFKAKLTKGTKLTKAQSNVIMNGLKSNLLNPETRAAFIERAKRAIESAEYANKLDQASKLKSKISEVIARDNKLPLAKRLPADVKLMAKSFASINANNVEDLDEYNKNAAEVYESIKTPKIVDGELQPRVAARQSEINDYSGKIIAKQDEDLRKSMLSNYKSLVDSGVLDKDSSLEEIREYVEAIESGDKEKLKINKVALVKNATEKMMRNLNTFLSEKIAEEKAANNGKLSEDAILANKVANMDLSILTPDKQLRAVEAVENYIQNGSTFGMDGLYESYDGALKAKNDEAAGIKSNKYSVGLIGKLPVVGEVYSDIWGKYISRPDSLLANVFKSNENARKFLRNSGFYGVVNGFVDGTKVANVAADNYSKIFGKTKPNDIEFASAYNNFERGIYGDLTRQITDASPQEEKVELRRKLKQLELTIEELSNSSKKIDNSKAEMYQQVLDKIKGDKSIEQVTLEDVENAIDQTNKDAVQFWRDQWGDHYDRFRDIAAGTYNIMLDKDKNYLPEFYEKRVLDVEDDLFSKGNFSISFDFVDQKPSGNLLKNNRIEGLPTSPEGDVTRVRDYDFDANNYNAFKRTLIDINTANSVAQYMGYVNSPSFKKMIPDTEERKFIKDRLNYNIQLLRGRDYVPNSRAAKTAMNMMTWISKYGSRGALSSLFALPGQSLPMAFNTIINTIDSPKRAFVDMMEYASNDDVKNFVAKSGYGISIRSEESITSIDNAKRLLEKSASGNLGKIAEAIDKLSEAQFKALLVNPDVFVANASWFAYYKYYLNKKGVNVDNIDWSKEKVNEEAADYAEYMVQEQQNSNVSELGGKLLSGKDAKTRLIRTLFFPFSSYKFSLQDKNNKNWGIIMSPANAASTEDRLEAAKSLSSGIVESVVYNGLRILFSSLLAKGVYKVLGREETEEEKELREDGIMSYLPADFIGEYFIPTGPGIQESILDIIDLAMDVYQGGTPEQQAMAEKEEEQNQPRERRRKFSMGDSGQAQKDKLKKERLQEILDKRFRFNDGPDVPESEALRKNLGGVPYTAISTGIAFYKSANNLIRGYYINKYGKKITYSDADKKKLAAALAARGIALTNATPRPTAAKMLEKAVNKDAQANQPKKERPKSFKY
jgi:hypothetical protein